MASSPCSSFTSDQNLVLSLLRLARELSIVEPHKLLQRRNFSSLSRRSKLLSLFFEELLHNHQSLGGFPRSAVLCLREILVVLQKFKALATDCSARSRMRLLLQAQTVCNEFHELTVDLSTLLDILPLNEIEISDDVKDMVELVRRQCRRSSPTVDPAEDILRREVLNTIKDVESEIVPEGEKLEKMLVSLSLDDSSSCRDEIECLEKEIGDKVAENLNSSMVALVGVLRYAKCVLFGASTPRSDSSTMAGKFGFSPASEIIVPTDFRCPITLELMKDPVVVASGQTYDRDSITKWIASGHATCPKTGQTLANTGMVPNLALKNLIAKWCREQKIPYDSGTDAGVDTTTVSNKAATEAARMTAAFLVGRLSFAGDNEGINRVVHEIRQLARTSSDNRAFLAEAGAIPMLIPLLKVSEPAGLQVNAVTALLNLSILDINRKRIMHADGGIDGILHVLKHGVSWQGKANAAATLLSLSSNHSYRRRIGRNQSVVIALIELVNAGPSAAKKDALAAMLSLAGDRENVPRLVESGVVSASLEATGSTETTEEAVAILAAVAKRGGGDAICSADGAISKLVRVLRRGSDWARESAAAALVLLCRRSGSDAVTKVVSSPGIEWAIWELMGSGTDRGRRKAAALGRICRRWLAAKEVDRTANNLSSITITVPSTTLEQN